MPDSREISPGVVSFTTPGRRASLATVEVVQEIWASVLGVATVGPDDDFFDLGGNSLIVAEALAPLAARMRLELPLDAVFEAPTPAEMAELIAELRAGRPAQDAPMARISSSVPKWVIPLQRAGERRPVWLFPGGKGGLWTLKRDAQVAALVGWDHPFYGFRRDKPHLDPTRADWAPAMAAAYVEQIQAIQRFGPYLLYGVCSGGAFAWEVATRLLAGGQEISGILFLEVPDDPDHAGNVPPVSSPRAGTTPATVPAGLQPLPVDLTLLMTEAWHARGRSAGWRQMTHGEPITVVMPGDTPGAHNLYINREPMIAGHLRDWIARSEANWAGR